MAGDADAVCIVTPDENGPTGSRKVRKEDGHGSTESSPSFVRQSRLVAALKNGAKTTLNTGSAVRIYVADPDAFAVIVQNRGLGNMVVGEAGVTPDTGTLVVPGGSIVIRTPVAVGDIYAVRETGVDTIAYAAKVA